MIDWKKARIWLLAGAGAYLIYIAYSLFQERNTDSVMPLWINYLFSAFFLLAAIAIIVYAYILWKKAKAEDEKYRAEHSFEETPDE